VTRRRAATVMLLVLVWCAAAPWLGLGRAPASGAVLAASERVEHAPALVSRAAVAEHVARLSRSDVGAALAADPQPQRAMLAAGSTHTRFAPAFRRLHHRRALARRGGRAPDEPS
jgi:hypothetical protein